MYNKGKTLVLQRYFEAFFKNGDFLRHALLFLVKSVWRGISWITVCQGVKLPSTDIFGCARIVWTIFRFFFLLLTQSGSTAGSNYFVRILSTLDREVLKPNTSVALHRHSHSVVEILPPESDSTIQLMQERPDVTYHDIGGMDMQKQEVRMVHHDGGAQ